jgi:hypothetical protein
LIIVWVWGRSQVTVHSKFYTHAFPLASINVHMTFLDVKLPRLDQVPIFNANNEIDWAVLLFSVFLVVILIWICLQVGLETSLGVRV